MHNTTIIISGILVVATVALTTAFRYVVQHVRSHVPLPTARRRIASLDLSDIRKKAMKRHGWHEEHALFLEGEYRDFLILLAENLGHTLSPWTNDLDLFWHEHILNTTRYAADCKAIFGRFIQHDPLIEQRPYHHEETKSMTMALREAQLKARYERQQAAASSGSSVSAGGDGFDLATWGCSADTGSSSHGHSDGGSHGGHSCGGHSGGGHSCGGHSCGGHSCGGHSCGGGGGCGGGH